MLKYFYASKTKEPLHAEDSYKVPRIEPQFDLKTTTLESGNRITSSQQLINWIHGIRSKVIDRQDAVVAEYTVKEKEVKEDAQATKKYLKRNVFNCQYENDERLVPSAGLTILAYFTGRILCNRHNWSHRGNSIWGKLFTSIPSKMILPFAMGAYMFSIYTPRTWSNFVHTMEDDFLPQALVHDYKGSWDRLYTHGLKRDINDFEVRLNTYLQDSVKSMRLFVSEL